MTSGSELRPVDLLLVDDRPENLRSLRAILEDEPGYRLVEARTGAEALRSVLRHDFAVIVLDVLLPDLDGSEVARLIKQRARSRDVPILFLTAEPPDAAALRRAYALGAADFLLKPVSPDIVRAKVAVFVDLYRKTQQLREQAELIRRHEQEKQAELRMSSERRYRHLAESIPQIVWRALPDGQIEYWNQRWFDYTGNAERAGSDSAWAYLHPEDRDKCVELWRASLSDGSPYQCECRLLRKDGTYRWHLRRALPERASDGRIVAWLGTDTDIDERKRADEERIGILVRERAARMEAEAAQHRAAQLYVEAREAVHVRDEFLTVAAHELRTPLTTVRLQVQLIERSGFTPEKGRTLQRQLERLCRLIDQLLDVSRIAGGRLQLELQRTDLRVLTHEVAGRLREEASRNGCTLEVRDAMPIAIECDPLRIEQVIANLITNAIKYGRGKPIEVELDGDEEAARLRVTDKGIGIPPEEQARIFERYARAVSVREYGGLGLGLFITRQIVEAHGGTVRVASAVGEGSTFEVVLPARRPQQPPAPGVH